MIRYLWLSSLLLLVGGAHGFITSPTLPRQLTTTAAPPVVSSSSSRLQAKQTSTKPNKSSASRKGKINSLLDWAKSDAVNIQTANLELKDDGPAGLGWFASSALDSNSVVMTVPTAMALTVESPGQGPDDPAVARDLFGDDNNSDARKIFRDDMPWFVQMSLYLFKLDRVDSTKNKVNLRTWLDCLPREFDTPIHWDAETVDQCQYDYMTKAVQRQESTWKSYYQQLASSIKQQPLSWDDFVWGCECARSRAFSGAYTGSAFNPAIYAFTLLLVTAYVGLNLGTLEQAANGAGVVICASILKDFVLPKLFKTKKYAICPLIDMTNHQSNTLAVNGEVAFEYFANAYSLAISSPVPAGNQVYISYGTRSNDQLLQYYGFCEPDNPADVYVMPPLRDWDIGALEEACGRTFAAGRLEKLDRAGLLGSSSTVPAGDNDGTTAASGDDDAAANLAGGVVLTRATGMDPAVLQALRALVSSDAEWDDAGQAIGNFAEEFSGGRENEKCARLAARKAIEMELASKPTTMKEDKDLLQKMESMKSLDASRAEQLAVQFRIEKKKLLQETIQKLN